MQRFFFLKIKVQKLQDSHGAVLRPTTMLARDRFRGRSERPCQSNDDMTLPDADEEDGELDRLRAL
jgi:hypothetical protein